MKIFITGIAGFIGYSLAEYLIKNGYEVNGYDIYTDYYDVQLKKNRFSKIEKNLTDFKISEADIIVHLAAQAGVLYSKINPFAYIDNNITCFLHILEMCKETKIPLLYATSSTALDLKSVYGITKKCDEDLAKLYSKNYDMKILGVRFYTVYGPWGRPDMAMWKWTEAILKKEPISIRGKDTSRNFTYINDLTKHVTKIINTFLSSNIYEDSPIIGIANMNSRFLDEVVDIIEQNTNIKAIREYTNLFPEEIQRQVSEVSFEAHTDIEIGVPEFVKWYKEYFNI